MILITERDFYSYQITKTLNIVTIQQQHPAWDLPDEILLNELQIDQLIEDLKLAKARFDREPTDTQQGM
jgi:hypothetical protein